MSTPRPFHRLFGLAWLDFFEGTTVKVEPELDTAVQQTLLDVAITNQLSEPLNVRMPDGFEKMPPYCVFTFKSYREALKYWAILESIQHFVSWRKKLSKGEKRLLPANQFRIYAVCVRRPQILDHFPRPVTVSPGVYDCRGFGLTIRIIVIRELPLEPHNAMLHLFSARKKAMRYGMRHYRNRSTETSALICAIFAEYLENPKMPNRLKEFAQKKIQELLGNLPTEERLKGVPPEELRKRLSTEECLKDVPTEERLKGVPPEELRKRLSTEECLKDVPTEELRKRLSPEQRLKDLSPEQRLVGLSADEVLQGLSPEALDALKRKLRANGAAPSNPPADNG